ncbi:MAG TPA: DUF309 domain-containing protein [Abditibacteriaceae bacterium]|jgi:hypothetical protein
MVQSHLDVFWRLYRAGHFFAAHEALEDLWRETTGETRQQLHGLIHGAIAREHHVRGNPEGAARQALRMRVRLRQFGDCAEFCAEVEAAITSSLLQLDEGARARLGRLEKELEK